MEITTQNTAEAEFREQFLSKLQENMKNAQTEFKELNKALKEVLNTSVYILIVLILTYCVVTFVGQRTEVIGSSMESSMGFHWSSVV